MNSNRRTRRGAALALAAAGLMTVSGCFSLARTESPTRHYLLGASQVQEVVAPRAALSGLAIGVRRLRLAAYLEPEFVAVRRGDHEIDFSEYHRWGEPLGAGINRATIEHLGRRGSFRAIDVAPWPAREAYDYVLQLHVDRFEGVASADVPRQGSIHMLVRWELLRQADGVVLARGTTEHHEPEWAVGDYESLVHELDVGLVALARDLAVSLESLSTRSSAAPPPGSNGATSPGDLPPNQ